jgi:hypothetical protein
LRLPSSQNAATFVLPGRVTTRILSKQLNSMVKSYCCHSTGAQRIILEHPMHAMESQACLDLVVELLYDTYHCIAASICVDDDMSTRGMLKWSNAD